MQGLSGDEELNLAQRGGIEPVINLVEGWIDLDSGVLGKIKRGRFACLWGWGI